MTSPPGGEEPGGPPQPLTEARGRARPMSPCSRSPAAISSFFRKPEVSQGGRGPRGDSETRSPEGWGEGKRGHSHCPGGRGLATPGSPQVHSGARAPPERDQATQAPQHSSLSPGLASRPAPTLGGLTGARTPRSPALTGGAAVGALRVSRPLQQLQEGPPLLPGHGSRCRGRGRAGAGSVHPAALGPHAGRPPPPLRHPGPPQPARRFRIPAARPGAAAARVAAAAAERVPAQGPGRSARFGRNGPRAAPSGAGARPPGAPTRRP